MDALLVAIGKTFDTIEEVENTLKLSNVSINNKNGTLLLVLRSILKEITCFMKLLARFETLYCSELLK